MNNAYEEKIVPERKLITVFPGVHIAKFYPVILEGYKITKRSLSKRLKYEATFTKEERTWIKKKIGTTWHRWHFVTGAPQEVSMGNKKYILMVEAANFFATI